MKMRTTGMTTALITVIILGTLMSTLMTQIILWPLSSLSPISLLIMSCSYFNLLHMATPNLQNNKPPLKPQLQASHSPTRLLPFQHSFLLPFQNFCDLIGTSSSLTPTWFFTLHYFLMPSPRKWQLELTERISETEFLRVDDYWMYGVKEKQILHTWFGWLGSRIKTGNAC